jgi:PAS domain S-box-containing protein
MAMIEIEIGDDVLEAQLQATLNMIPAYVWYAAPSGGLIFVNERCADYLGLPQHHPLRFGADTGGAWDSQIPLLHPDDQEETRRVWSECLSTSRPGEVSFRVRDAHGNYRSFLGRMEPFRGDDGAVLYWIGINLDIDEREQAEFDVTEHEKLTNALRTSEMELLQTLDLAPQIIGKLGPRRERLYANRATLAYYGLTLDEWLRGSFRSEVDPEDHDRFKAAADAALVSGSEFDLELRLRDRDGHSRWHLARYNPLRDDNGHVVRWYVACTDIDDRKRAEERLRQENVALREEVDKASMFEEIVGTSPALTAVLSRVSKVASSDSTVLITGETGTGKELVARAIHRRSRRASRAFVAVNCAAIPRELIASELFGHEKGAFTGAIQRRLGRFELAHGGTIFLDEIGELSSDTQVALLRVLQEREFERVGGQHPIRVDVRVIAATNRDLTEAVAGGTFRQDLFYRLNVFPLEMPPLRDRQQDIPVMVEYFVGRYARKAGKTFRRVSKRTLDRLQSYLWPGNVRELQNVIERSVIVSDADEFTVDENWLAAAPPVDSRLGLSGALAAHEKAIVEDALRASGGRVFGPSGAAARLGIPRSTLNFKIRALKINKSRFRVPAPQRS